MSAVTAKIAVLAAVNAYLAGCATTQQQFPAVAFCPDAHGHRPGSKRLRIE